MKRIAQTARRCGKASPTPRFQGREGLKNLSRPFLFFPVTVQDCPGTRVVRGFSFRRQAMQLTSVEASELRRLEGKLRNLSDYMLAELHDDYLERISRLSRYRPAESLTVFRQTARDLSRLLRLRAWRRSP